MVPLYNTNINFLKEMIESVILQTYTNWELCLVDGSDIEYENIKNLCMEHATKDDRIKYKKLHQNWGISENSNICVSLATGHYLVLFDHHDLLGIDALYENAIAIEETNADILYSDEDHVTEKGQHLNPLFKPDWSLDLLYSQMYICHLLVFKKEIFNKVGGFNKDYYLMLRLSEKTTKIYHIPKVLYSWRETLNSTAMDATSKPYAHIAGLNAYRENIDPYFNINLDINSVIPKERTDNMNLVNFKNKYKIHGKA